jgi:hypothetical protein
MGVNGSPNAPVKSYNKDSLTNCQFRALLVHVSSARPALQHDTPAYVLESGGEQSCRRCFLKQRRFLYNFIQAAITAKQQ